MAAVRPIPVRKILLRLVLGFVLMLLVAEVVLWVFFRQGVEPAVEVKYWQEFPGLKRDVVYRRNGLGLRTLSIDTWKKPDDVVRIICLGASTTDQGTQNSEDMWMAHLERMLNEAVAGTGKAVQVGTYARGGNKMPEVLTWVNRRLEALEPDLVITLFGMNTLCTEALIPEHVNFDLLRDRVIEARRGASAEEVLLPFSQIYRHGRQAAANAEAAAYLEKNGGLNFDIQGVPVFRRRYWQTRIDNSVPDLPGRTNFFRDATEYLAGWLEERGIRQVVLAQPLLLHDEMDYGVEDGRVRLSPGTFNREAVLMAKEELQAIWFVVNAGKKGVVRMTPGRFREDMDHFNRVQEEVAGKRGVPFVALDDLIEPSLENFFDDCHFTDLGSQRVAEAAFPQIREVVEEIIGENQKSRR